MAASKTCEGNSLLRELRDNGAYSDLTIKCGGVEFRVHKCIVCPQSTFFRNACEKQKWKEGDTGVIELKAAQESIPDLGDDDPRSVKLMIDYLYLHDYDPRTAKAPISKATMENRKDEECTARAKEVEQTGERYQSPSSAPVLGCEAKMFDGSVDETVPLDVTDDIWGFAVPKKGKKGKKITRPMSEDHYPQKDSADAAPSAVQGPSSFLEMHAKVFALASKYDIRSLECEARKKFKDETKRSWETVDLIAAIHVVFNLTPDSESELRSILKDTMVQHALKLVQHPDFEDAVASIDGLAYNLFRRQTYAWR